MILSEIKLNLFSALLRAWPFPNGAGRIVARYGHHVDTGVGLRTCRTLDGLPMTVLADDYIGRHLILAGGHDRALVNTLLAFGRPGDLCLDVGANIGYVATLILAKLSNSVIHCVEPQPQVGELLERNLEQFETHRWSILDAALSDAETDGVLHIDQANRGASSLKTPLESSQSFPVRVVSADAYLKDFEKLDLVKIDIEGFEETVFTSAKAQLDRLQPRAILYEDHEGKSAPGGSIHAILTEIGYDIFAIRKKLTGVELVPMREDTAEFDDFVAVSRTRELPPEGKRLLP